jgi:hypothetical protein
VIAGANQVADDQGLIGRHVVLTADLVEFFCFMGLGKVPLGKDAGGNPPGVTLTPRFKDAAIAPNTNCQAV